MLDSLEPRCLTPRPDFKTAQLSRLADWAVNETRATTVGDLIAACSRGDLPEDVSLLRASVYATPLYVAFPGLVPEQRLALLRYALLNSSVFGGG